MAEKLRILVVDDSEDDLILTCYYLVKIDTFDLQIEKEINYNQARKRILQNDQDIYILDYLLGPHTGLELIMECIKAGVNKPFILLTGKGDKAIDVAATKAGVYDYLIKSELNTEQLERSLRYSLQRYSSYAAIAESEKKYREIFTKSNDIIFVLDKEFNFLNFNLMMTKLMEYENTELIHKPFARLFENADDAANLIKHIQSNEANKDIEITLLTKSGARKTFLASFSKIVSTEGEPQFQSILHDYTNIKKSVAENLLKEKIEATSKLVRSLAHEVRNPLTNIDLSVHQLETEIAEDERQIFTDIIKRNSKRIGDLIGELMNVSNPATNTYEQIELNELVQASLAHAKDRIMLKEIGITEIFTPNKLQISADRVKFKQLSST